MASSMISEKWSRDVKNIAIFCNGLFITGVLTLRLAMPQPTKDVDLLARSEFLTPLCVFSALLLFTFCSGIVFISNKSPFYPRVMSFCGVHLVCWMQYALLFSNAIPAHVNVDTGVEIQPVRYLAWMATLPLTIYTAYSQSGVRPIWQYYRCCFFAWSMTLFGLLASCTVGNVCNFALGTSWLNFLMVIWDLDQFFHSPSHHDKMKHVIRMVAMFGWSIIPVGYMLRFFGVVGQRWENILYAVGDISAKSVVCFMIEIRFVLHRQLPKNQFDQVQEKKQNPPLDVPYDKEKTF